MEPVPTPQPPSMTPQVDQCQRDAEHIRLLVVFHYISAGFMALAACLPIIHLLMGLAMVSGKIPMISPSSGSGPSAGTPPPDPAVFGWIFVGIAGVLILLGWAFAAVVFLAGRYLSERRNWTFVFVIACIQCLSMPIGTALGVFTILVLQRPTVRALFGKDLMVTPGHSNA